MLHVDVALRRGSLALEVALDVEAGTCVALAGPSGAGKSTVLRIVAGLLAPDRGVVRCGEVSWLDTERRIDRPPERRSAGLVFQDYALFGHLSAWRNVAYGLRSLPRADRRARAEELLERLGLGERRDARPAELSGGERQRVALARALATRPAVLLLDEPLSALDVRTRASAGRVLAGVLRDAGVPSLLVTHDFAEAALLGDRVGVMDAGRIVQLGTAAELAARPASAFVADLTGAVVLTGVARPGADGLTEVRLDGGGVLVSTDEASGEVAASVYPWEIVLEPGSRPPDAVARSSAQNRLAGRVLTVTEVGGRARVGLDTAQPLVAEVTTTAVRELGLGPGVPVTAAWKAAATRLVAR